MASEQSLSRRERQVMDALFQAGEATATEVRERIPDAPGYSAVRTMLRILEEKGFIEHRTEGRRYVFRPLRSSGIEGRSALQRVIQVFFGGSLAHALAAHFNDPSTELDDAELGRMRVLIKEIVERERATTRPMGKGKKL